MLLRMSLDRLTPDDQFAETSGSSSSGTGSPSPPSTRSRPSPRSSSNSTCRGLGWSGEPHSDRMDHGGLFKLTLASSDASHPRICLATFSESASVCETRLPSQSSRNLFRAEFHEFSTPLRFLRQITRRLQCQQSPWAGPRLGLGRFAEAARPRPRLTPHSSPRSLSAVGPGKRLRRLRSPRTAPSAKWVGNRIHRRSFPRKVRHMGSE